MLKKKIQINKHKEIVKNNQLKHKNQNKLESNKTMKKINQLTLKRMVPQEDIRKRSSIKKRRIQRKMPHTKIMKLKNMGRVLRNLQMVRQLSKSKNRQPIHRFNRKTVSLPLEICQLRLPSLKTLLLTHLRLLLRQLGLLASLRKLRRNFLTRKKQLQNNLNSQNSPQKKKIKIIT